MVDTGVAKIQLGKAGLTENFLQTLETYFKKHRNVKVSVLKAARPERADTKKYEEELLEALGKKYTARTVGHTIALKKWRQDKR